MARYRLSNQAREDLIRIHQYGSLKFGEAQADQYFSNFFDAFERISKHPFSYESVDYIKSGYHRCVCGVDSIFYRINEDVVEITAIIGRQNTDLIFR